MDVPPRRNADTSPRWNSVLPDNLLFPLAHLDSAIRHAKCLSPREDKIAYGENAQL